MSTTKTRRGRPKGTGIDDRVPLTQIAALMAQDPDLKPTTAIRRLGITEPSVIRRLRDKFKVFSQEQLSQKHSRESQPVFKPGMFGADSLRHDHSSLTQAPESEQFSAIMMPSTDTGKVPGFHPEVQNFVAEIRV